MDVTAAWVPFVFLAVFAALNVAAVKLSARTHNDARRTGNRVSAPPEGESAEVPTRRRIIFDFRDRGGLPHSEKREEVVHEDLPSLAPELTSREQAVLTLLVEGRDVGEIVEQLNASRESVQEHIKVILLKLGTESPEEAARLAVQHQLVSSPGEEQSQEEQSQEEHIARLTEAAYRALLDLPREKRAPTEPDVYEMAHELAVLFADPGESEPRQQAIRDMMRRALTMDLPGERVLRMIEIAMRRMDQVERQDVAEQAFHRSERPPS